MDVRRLMTGVLILSSLLILTPAAISDEGKEASLRIEVNGLRPNEGTLAYALYDSSETYDSRTAPVRSGFVPVRGKKCRVEIEDLPPGTYAAMFYQDRNDNGQLDRNGMGIPSEPYGFSNNARAMFGPPSFGKAKFVLATGTSPLKVKLR